MTEDLVVQDSMDFWDKEFIMRGDLPGTGRYCDHSNRGRAASTWPGMKINRQFHLGSGILCQPAIGWNQGSYCIFRHFTPFLGVTERLFDRRIGVLFGHWKYRLEGERSANDKSRYEGTE